ncbi:unspecific monooxygenase [Sarracenia purpurea var. burkii]
MEIWFLIVVSLCISALLKSLFNLIHTPSSSSEKKLPPGPTSVPVIGNLLWLRPRSFVNFESVLRDLRAKYGPIITLRIGSRRPTIFVSSHSLAHQALVQNGAVFSDRPKALATSKIVRNQHNISSAAYGSTWRLLRRNLTSEILNPSRVKSYSRARQWVLAILIERLLKSGSVVSSTGSAAAPAVKVIDHFHYAMFCLLVLMCFGDRLDEIQIKQIEQVQRQMLLRFGRFTVLNLWPRLGKILFRNRWEELRRLRQDQEDVLIPLIRDRMEVVKRRRQRQHQHQQEGKQDEQKIEKKEEEEEEGEEVVAYVDSLLDLELPDEKRKLDEGEMVSLCGEFLNGGTDTTATGLQWIMANLVKYPRVQGKLYEEIVGVMGLPPPPPQGPGSKRGGDDERRGKVEEEEKVIKEEDVQRMPYLKAVILEGLRRHPPGHFVLPHRVTEDVELEGHLVPKNAVVNFMVAVLAEMGRDPKVWEEPMEFKPERFIGGGGGRELWSSSLLFDITGRKEIKMMPFGVGRRICPAYGLAMLHLELFVANLVWYFEWRGEDGDDIDLSEKQEFTTVMKNPLRAHISPRVTTAFPLQNQDLTVKFAEHKRSKLAIMNLGEVAAKIVEICTF